MKRGQEEERFNSRRSVKVDTRSMTGESRSKQFRHHRADSRCRRRRLKRRIHPFQRRVTIERGRGLEELVSICFHETILPPSYLSNPTFLSSFIYLSLNYFFNFDRIHASSNYQRYYFHSDEYGAVRIIPEINGD